MSDAGPLDISACEREPVHIPGRVQPHGVLLALSEPDMTILQASANAEALLHRAAVSLAGQSLDVLLDPEPVQRLREALLCKHVTVIPVRLFTVRVRGCPTLFDATAHCAGDVLILEMEPQPPPPSPGTPDLNYLLKTGFPHLAQSDSLLAFCQAAAEMVRRITGFDRVMVYRFDSDWNGEVIAEDKRTDWEPYLGLRYPASDIPRQAREMYLKTALRLIVDVHAEPVPLVPLLSPSTGAALDMTYAILRAVSPVHIEYLKNMGVGASMSIAIVKRGVLWGLIACHHETGRYVPYDVRSACEILGQVVSLLVPEKEAAGEHEYAVALMAAQTSLVAAVSSAGNVLSGLVDAIPSVADFVECGGAAVLLDERCVLLGRTPDEEAVRRLAAWLAQSVPGEIYATQALARDYPEAAEWADTACGLLAIPLTRVSQSYVLWFRPEMARTVNWAGDPNKRAEVVDGMERLSPRKSFAQWQESVRGESLPWRSAEVAAARELRQAILGMFVHLSEVRRIEEQRHAAYEREHRIAETLQTALLTDVPEEGFPGLAVAALYEAAWSEANVGGDFFDAFALSGGQVALVVGDVVGKGLAAARHIMETKFALRALLMEQAGDPGECLTRLNALVYASHRGDVSSLIALSLVVVEPQSGEVRCASAGAEHPLLVHEDGRVRPLAEGDFALGISPDTRYASRTDRPSRDETLLMLTDGITESRQGTAFLDTDGAVRLLASVSPNAPVRAAAKAVLEGAKAFSGGTLRDDACVLVARRRAPQA
ncbi:MAG TPA: SpoIIE family protein phosphatase [Longimicrobiaceae bacterium]|nr:SpoIIE family protein phosphatase [Longimicrobiaceae bacterium]